MSLPTIEKTWQFDLNRTVACAGASTTYAKPILRAIKDRWKAFGTLPATVSRSCNGTTAGTLADGVDRWAADADIVPVSAAGTAHSWMVINLVGMGSPAPQLVIDCIGSTSSQFAEFWFSPSGAFITGGTTLNRPTATDEYKINYRTNWVQATTSANVRLHLWESSDGACRRVAVMYNNFLTSLIILDNMKNPRGGTASPYLCAAIGSSGTAASTGTFTEMFAAYECFVRNSTTTGTASLTCEGVNTTGLGAEQTSADDIDSSWPVLPIAVFSNTSGARGRYGQVYDLWYGSSGNSSGQEFDDAGGKVLGQLGHLLFPSNGLTLAIA